MTSRKSAQRSIALLLGTSLATMAAPPSCVAKPLTQASNENTFPSAKVSVPVFWSTARSTMTSLPLLMERPKPNLREKTPLMINPSQRRKLRMLRMLMKVPKGKPLTAK